MFTGIIEEIGKIVTITNKSISLQAKKVLEGTKIGDSIAVNGVCLTVTNFVKDGFIADVSPETFNVTSLCKFKVGMAVNLERAVSVNGRFGGHIVSGHVDGTGIVKSFTKNGEFYNLVIELDKKEEKYVVKKGSITINGISLTVAEQNSNSIMVAVIPHTVENTSLKEIKNGDIVNIETDILAKYVEKFLSTRDNRSGISLEFLQQNGF